MNIFVWVYLRLEKDLHWFGAVPRAHIHIHVHMTLEVAVFALFSTCTKTI